MWFDEWLVWLSEGAAFAERELGSRSFFEWLFCFAPLLVLLEVPRYCLPALGLLFRRVRGDKAEAYTVRGRFPSPPLVSVIVAGRNEEASIEGAIRSLLDQDYPAYEIIVVDDSSSDRTAEIVRRHASGGRIRFLRNEASRGRGGKPSALNMGMAVARGEFLVSVDADTRFARDMVRQVVAPLADGRIGVVAGNVKVRNAGSLLTRLQSFEYSLAIDLYKRWTDRSASTLQASGAVAAFRVRALREIGGWSPELAEDTDVSLRMIKAGWRVAFAPRAVAWTDAPETLSELAAQRARWSRGGWRTFLLKHHRLMRPTRGRMSIAYELGCEMLFFVLGTFAVPLYLTWLAFQGVFSLLFVLLVTGAAYGALSLSLLALTRSVTEADARRRIGLAPALLMPLYMEWLRWVRLRALLAEFLLIGSEHPFLPRSAWAHKARF